MKATTGPQAEGRIDVGRYKPEDVTIIGIDTSDTIHPLLDKESNATPVSEVDVKFTMRVGIIMPVGCKRDGDRLVVIYGRGRVRQLREANKRLTADGKDPWPLPAQVWRGDEAKLLALMHGENSHRRVINPMARAREALLLSEKMLPDDAAVILGVSLSQFKNILALNDLAAPVIKEVVKGTVSPTAAIQFVGMSEDDQATKLAELLSSGEKPTVERAARKAREASGKEEKLTPKGRLVMISAALDKLEESATKDDLWRVINKIKKAVA